MSDVHRAFQLGAERLAAGNCKYTELHKGHGIDEFSWKQLTQDEYWSPDQVRQMRNIIANAVEVSMTIAGMPAVPLPGQYVAAFIAKVVAPCNQLMACSKVPETFDAFVASGLMQTSEVKKMDFEQMVGLVMAYSGDYVGEPPAHRLPREISDKMKEETLNA